MDQRRMPGSRNGWLSRLETSALISAPKADVQQYAVCCLSAFTLNGQT